MYASRTGHSSPLQANGAGTRRLTREQENRDETHQLEAGRTSKVLLLLMNLTVLSLILCSSHVCSNCSAYVCPHICSACCVKPSYSVLCVCICISYFIVVLSYFCSYISTYVIYIYVFSFNSMDLILIVVYTYIHNLLLCYI